MEHPFEWHDWLRALTILTCLFCVFFLARSWLFNRQDWSSKTLDYWYALMAWSIAGIVICVEGIARNLGFGPRSIFIIIASTVTLKAVMAKGAWGERSASS